MRQNPPVKQHKCDCPENLMHKDQNRGAGWNVPGEHAERQVNQPCERQYLYDRLRPIRKQRKRDDHARQKRHERRQNDRSVPADSPQETDVDKRRHRPQPKSSVHASVAPKASAAAVEGGPASRHSPRPTSGRTTTAIAHIGAARSIVGAVRQASARAYQRKYKSMGRHSSYATAPLRTMARISASAFHGSIARSACPSQT